VGSIVDDFTRYRIQKEAERVNALKEKSRRLEEGKAEARRRTQITDEHERAGQAIRDLQAAGKKLTKAEQDRKEAADKALDQLLGKKKRK
jgi:hypothetical protein